MNKTQFLRLLDELLELEEGTLKGGEILEALEDWTSLTVVGFIALADEEFGVAPSPDKIRECRTIDDLIALLSGQLKD